ncbi:DUF7689 domain-containing protein [Paraburkholderia tropica]|uniref:DUF7689 domain-containing protein n=1 Tax=Paraburkholderia tropica TaxID=92647 RepID=UPI0031D9E2A0
MLYTAQQLERIYQGFPNINKIRFQITSPPTPVYNCIAWAATQNDVWWWPSADYYWPEGLPLNDESIANFTAAFATLGYSPCQSGELEEGYEKVVLYSAGGLVKHMARQLKNGGWTSKLGQAFDVSHGTDACLSGNIYGACTHYLRRKSNPANLSGAQPVSGVQPVSSVTH